jgi:hypothetical protein
MVPKLGAGTKICEKNEIYTNNKKGKFRPIRDHKGPDED